MKWKNLQSHQKRLCTHLRRSLNLLVTSWCSQWGVEMVCRINFDFVNIVFFHLQKSRCKKPLHHLSAYIPNVKKMDWENNGRNIWRTKETKALLKLIPLNEITFIFDGKQEWNTAIYKDLWIEMPTKPASTTIFWWLCNLANSFQNKNAQNTNFLWDFQKMLKFCFTFSGNLKS